MSSRASASRGQGPREQRHAGSRPCAMLAHRLAGMTSRGLKQPLDLAVLVDADAVGGGVARQAGHGHQVAAQRHDEARARRQPHVAHRQDEARRRAAHVRLGGEAVLRLRHADGEPSEAVALILLELLGGVGRERDIGGAIDLARDGADLVDERHVVGIERLERAALFAKPHDLVRQALGALAAVGPVAAEMGMHAGLAAGLGDDVRLGLGEACTPAWRQASAMTSVSALVSAVKWLIATVTGTPNLRTFSMWRSRFAVPAFTASTFSRPSSFLSTPPCILSARTVATITAAEGVSPDWRHLMSKNFSAPRSAPKPASVTT